MTDTDPTVLRARDLRIRVPGRVLVDALSFDTRPGEFIAVLGQNGSGKSLSLLTLAGLRPGDSGTVTLGGRDIFSTPRQATAKILALLPQHSDDSFPATVIETTLTGRHPHIGRFSWESNHDRDIAARSLQAMDIEQLAQRDVMTLSGGERRRLAMAQILTQQPSVYLLDEPTNHLDPQHQLDALLLFRQQADQGATVIATLHDANLAARFSDRCLLLYGDGRWDLGASSEMLEAERLSQLYQTAIEAVPWRDSTVFVAATPQSR